MGLPDDVRRMLGADQDVGSRRLDAAVVESLARGLRDLAAGERGWITFEDFRRLFESGEPGAERTRWRIGAVPPGPSWWTANTGSDAWARRFHVSEWTWTSPAALALAALASRHSCTPVRTPTEGRFYFTKDEPEQGRRDRGRPRG